MDLKVAEALSLFEAAVPRSQLVTQVHVMGHLTRQIHLLGPLKWHSMYPLESFFGELKYSVRYKKIPEAAIQMRYNLGQTIQNLVMGDPPLQNSSDPVSPALNPCGRTRKLKLSLERHQDVKQWIASTNPLYLDLARYAIHVAQDPMPAE